MKKFCLHDTRGCHLVNYLAIAKLNSFLSFRVFHENCGDVDSPLRSMCQNLVFQPTWLVVYALLILTSTCSEIVTYIFHALSIPPRLSPGGLSFLNMIFCTNVAGAFWNSSCLSFSSISAHS